MINKLKNTKYVLDNISFFRYSINLSLNTEECQWLVYLVYGGLGQSSHLSIQLFATSISWRYYKCSLGYENRTMKRTIRDAWRGPYPTRFTATAACSLLPRALFLLSPRLYHPCSFRSKNSKEKKIEKQNKIILLALYNQSDS